MPCSAAFTINLARLESDQKHTSAACPDNMLRRFSVFHEMAVTDILCSLADNGMTIE